MQVIWVDVGKIDQAGIASHLIGDESTDRLGSYLIWTVSRPSRPLCYCSLAIRSRANNK